jgi:hypothetical protein
MFALSFTAEQRTPANLSNASTDYALAVGETVVEKFVLQTSVPLRIATAPEGVYELVMYCDKTIAKSADGTAVLQPNNTTYASAIAYRTIYNTTGTPGGSGAAVSSFSLTAGLGTLVCLTMTITTDKVAKNIVARVISATTAGVVYQELVVGAWIDTTTVWSSIGTIVLPYAQTGTVIIKRIV